MRNAILGITVAALVALVATACQQHPEDEGEVVVYTSVDEVFARPIASQFESETGITVRLVPDTEETKSTGLLNRLIAEKARPRADVFWSGDPVRAAILKAQGVSQPYLSGQSDGLPRRYSDADGHWTGFSARARVLIYNTDMVSEDDRPESLFDLLDPRFKNSASLANPLFGTTSMHAAALFDALGEAAAREYFERFIENGGTIVSSNGEVRRRVAAGDFSIGITDTDDFNVAFQEGQPVAAVYPDQGGLGALIIPNAAVLIASGPNPEGARQFIDFLLRPETEQALAESEAAQMPLRPGVETPEHVRRLYDITPMDVDYSTLATHLEALSTGYLQDWVTRNSP
jgi:iron(III) transport system substrate-binding protein